MRVIVAGGRDFTDFNLLCEKCDYYLQNQEDIEIVSGVARGADMLAVRYAAERGYSVKEFVAEWDKLGKGAGYRRNEQMAEYADALIAFWDGRSKGTKHMIELAQSKGLKVKVVRYV